MYQTHFGKAVPLLMVLLLLGAGTTYGQNPTTPGRQVNQGPVDAPPTIDAAPKETANSGVYTGREIYVPKEPEEKAPEPAATSFADGFLRNTRQHVGASVEAVESYTPAAFASAGGKKDLYLTQLIPQVYFNFQQKQFEFRLTSGLAYTRYNKSLSDLNRVSPNGTVALTYGLGHRKTRLQFSSYFSSIYYDAGSALASGFASPYQVTFAPQIYLDQRRENRGTAVLTLSRAITRKASISAVGNYDFARYSTPQIPRRNLFSAGLAASYQVNKRINLNSQYYHYLNDVDPRFRNGDVDSLQVGGISIKAGGGWVVSFAGGVDSTRASGQRLVTGSGQAGISKTSRRTNIELGYHRGYSTVFPLPGVGHGDTASLRFVQLLSRRVTFRGDTSFIRNTMYSTTGRLDTVYGSAALDYAPVQNVVFSASYFLVSQKVENFATSGLDLHRKIMTVGVTYYLPSLRQERRP